MTPRYYDPIKEEIKERTERIKKQMEGHESGEYVSNISFQRKTSSAPSTSFLQILIAAILGTLTIGWLYYGNEVFYVLWLAVPAYLFFRLRKPSQRQR